MASFQFLTTKLRSVVKARPLSKGRNKNGAYIGMPKDWSKKSVKITLEKSSCGKCGSADVQDRGFRERKDGSKFKLVYCKDCKKFSQEPVVSAKVVGTTSFLVSAPAEWIGKSVIIELQD